MKSIFKIRRQEIFVIENITQIKPVFSKVDIEIEKITSKNLEHIVDFRETRHIKVFEGFLKQKNMIGIFAFFNSKAIAHVWCTICFRKHCRVNGYFNINNKEAFIHYCYVKENFRGQGVYSTMLKYMCEKLFKEYHVNKIFIDCEVQNIASKKAIEKVGFKYIKKGIYCQILSFLIFKKENKIRKSDR